MMIRGFIHIWGSLKHIIIQHNAIILGFIIYVIYIHVFMAELLIRMYDLHIIIRVLSMYATQCGQT